VLGGEVIEGEQVGFGPWLEALGELFEDVGRLVHPAMWLAGLRIDFGESGPEPEGSVPDRQLRSPCQSLLRKIQKEFAPALLALAIAVDHGGQLLVTLHSVPHQHHQALLLVGLIFQTDAGMEAVGQK
jgi:hypothetical protein